jgi:ribulose-bisphosphate carboxylase small chain
MRLSQGAFSYLPDLTQEQVEKQIAYATAKGWGISVEYTYDPHPRNVYWSMYGLPLFETSDPEKVKEFLGKYAQCLQDHPHSYVKINAFDASRGWESCALSFIVQRPNYEPGFYLTRQESQGRFQRYTL